MTMHADDIAAINDYFNRQPGKTQAAKDAKASWSAWYNSLSFMDKSFSDATVMTAKQRRVAFDAANGDGTRDGTPLTKEEEQYFLNLPRANITGKTPEEAKLIIAAASAKGAKIPVPATLLVAQIGTLKLGSKGPSVTKWQNAIGIVPASGVFDKATEAATRKFQGEHGIKVDGKVGPASWTAAQGAAPAVDGIISSLIASAAGKAAPAVIPTAAVTPASIKAPTPAFVPPVYGARPVLRKGSQNSYVSVWQKSIGVRDTGVFDGLTFEATKAWQARNGLFADGVVGAATWAKLDTLPAGAAAATATGTLAQITSGINAAKVSTASMFGGMGTMPTWAKVALSVIGLGGLGYGLKEAYKNKQGANYPGPRY